MAIEPNNVVNMVELYVDGELADAKKFENREPLDESGIYSLHILAADIYEAGFRDGRASEGERARREANRRVTAAKAGA